MQSTSPLCTAAINKVAEIYEQLNESKAETLKCNFALAFPGLSQAEILDLMRKHRQSLFHSELERRQLNVMPPAHLRRFIQKHVEIEGSEHLREAREGPEPVILFTPHYGSFAVGVLRAIMDFENFKKVSLFYESPEKNPTTSIYKGLMERLGCDARVLYNDKTAVLKGLRVLKKGQVLGMMPDVFEYNLGLMYVPFFGRLTVAMGGTAFFALKANARLIPGYSWRRERQRFVLQYGAPIELSRTGDMAEDIYRTTVRIFANIQEQLTVAPEHWVYWDTFTERMSYGAEIEIPRASDAWLPQFGKLRHELATDTSHLGRFLSSLEARLRHVDEPSQEAALWETIGAP